KALMAKANELFAKPPEIHKIDVWRRRGRARRRLHTARSQTRHCPGTQQVTQTITSVSRPTVPPANCVQPRVEVIPPNKPQRSSGLRPCLILVNQFVEAQKCASNVRTRNFKRQKRAARGLAVFYSFQAAHRS